MPNSYYNNSTTLTPYTRALAEAVEAKFDLVTAGFTLAEAQIVLRGAIAGQVWTGAHNFTGATITAATQVLGDATGKVATTLFVSNQAFSATLPFQGGNANKFVTTDGANASWSLVPLTTGISGVLDAANGGTGTANNTAATLVRAGNYALTLTLTGISGLTLPTAGTLATLAGAETLAAKLLQGEASVGVDKGTVGTGTVTFTVSAANFQRLQVSGGLTIAFTGWAATGNFSAVIIQEVNWGSAAVTTPTINWQLPAGGSTTTFATYLAAIGRAALQTSGTDWGLYWTTDGGTTVYGKLL